MATRAGKQLRERLEGKRVVVCVGSGGVGKTTVSAALALGLATRGRKVAVVTIDPANRLARALGLDGLAERAPPDRPGAAARPEGRGEGRAVGDDARRQAHVRRDRHAAWRRTPSGCEEILANPIYRELSTAVAGSQELSAIAKLYELHEEHDFDMIVLDTPPSRNALDFLNAPTRLLGFLEGRALQVFLAPERADREIVRARDGDRVRDLRARHGRST